MSYEFTRIPYSISFSDNARFKETYGGRVGFTTIDGMYYRPAAEAPASDTVLIFMHPSGLTDHLPICNALPKAGVPVICAASRYPKNDTALIMEKVVIDMGAHVRYAREKLGFEKVVLAGWSGGGSLSLFYQAEAEHPTITDTPAGDEVDLGGAGLIPADAVMQIACHVSRAIILTEWLDASIRNELDPDDRDPSLDLFGTQAVAPFDAAFLDRYRAAQIARSRRIDDYCWEMLEKLKTSPRGEVERCFVVHGTKADPAWFDPDVEPNDRPRGPHLTQGLPAVVNMSPAGLGRYSSLRSWLSQFSYAHSRATGPVCAGRVSVPVIVVEHSADDVCLPSHPRRIFEGVKHADKEMHVIRGAGHYYHGQPEQLAEGVRVCIDWLQRKGFQVGDAVGRRPVPA